MKTQTLVLAALFAWSGISFAADPLQTDPDKYHLVLENNHVRVLEYRDLPGDVTKEHAHPDFILYAVSPFERELTLPGGKILKRRFETGDVMYSPAQTHIGRNIGTTPTHVIMVELKSASDTLPTDALVKAPSGQPDTTH